MGYLVAAAHRRRYGSCWTHEGHKLISSVADALSALPPGRFLLVTIETPEGQRPRVGAPIVRPRGAADVFGAEPVAEYGNAPCIALEWAKTLEPLYAGHPGSIWPVAAIERDGDRVMLAGPLGKATFQQVPPIRLAEMCGFADAFGDVFGAAEHGRGFR